MDKFFVTNASLLALRPGKLVRTSADDAAAAAAAFESELFVSPAAAEDPKREGARIGRLAGGAPPLSFLLPPK